MNKIYTQLLIFSCILIEVALFFKISTTTHLITEQLLISIAIVVMLLVIKLIHHLSNTTFKNE
ncbi:MAG: hypothetical protein RL259_1495 [Bacteroidota bacterium]|jgi:hypothetical protein